jgi:hypothetical protein
LITLVAPHPSDGYAPKNGDIIHESGKYYLPVTKEEWELVTSLKKREYRQVPFILLTAIDENPWRALAELDIDYSRFKKLAEYKCPYTGYTHFGALPIAILAEDREKYQVGRFASKYNSYAWDMDFLKEVYKDRCFACEGIYQTLMGSGYTSYTRIGDGHGSRIHVKLKMSNGDHLLCYAWEWYNK